jgi:hypothetical protein
MPPKDTSRETYLCLPFLETESDLRKQSICDSLNESLKKQTSIVPREEAGTHLHLWSGRVVEGHVLEFNFTLYSIQLVTIISHAVHDGLLVEYKRDVVTMRVICISCSS